MFGGERRQSSLTLTAELWYTWELQDMPRVLENHSAKDFRHG